jgi:hypothetical protein
LDGRLNVAQALPAGAQLDGQGVNSFAVASAAHDVRLVEEGIGAEKPPTQVDKQGKYVPPVQQASRKALKPASAALCGTPVLVAQAPKSTVGDTGLPPNSLSAPPSYR